MAKTTVEDCLTLDVNRLNKIGALETPSSGTLDWTDGNRVGYRIITHPPGMDRTLRLDYVSKKEPVAIEIYIEYMEMPNGGYRPWFRCPLYKHNRKCGRRVAKLYQPWYSRYFGCRHCHDLAYRSQQEWIRPEWRPIFRYFNRITGRR